MAVVGRRQPLLVQPAATPASTMEAAALADLHGTTDTRDNEWFDVVAPSEYFFIADGDVACSLRRACPACSPGATSARSTSLDLQTFHSRQRGTTAATRTRPVACGKRPKQVAAKVTYRRVVHLQSV